MTYGFKSITYDEQLSELHKVNDWLVDLGIKTDESRFFKIIELNKLIVKHWIFPKKVDTVKRKVSGSVFHIQPGKDTQVLSAFSADYKRLQYTQRWNARYPDDPHIVYDKPARFS